MSTSTQHTGRADLVRKALAQFPQGATIEQLKTIGRVNASSHAISLTLTGLARTGHATCARSGRTGIWRLAPHVQHAIAPLRAAEPRERRTCRALVTALPENGRASDASTTVRHKDYERDQLAEDLAAFRAKGGRIEQLGTTPLRPTLSRHAANHGGDMDRLPGRSAE
ncbi:hypothetical protein [Stenotrophomonas sp.]|uniref:hypothetical protein n=1 Tax=Stenotrophomonas sp. TaxID=69392 RepID=UPI002D6A1455|nr:hypothetical protein [Stenotrophomonas sp.]HYQ23973.1 hypothetical protein [Stenotrophomonas sp.]